LQRSRPFATLLLAYTLRKRYDIEILVPKPSISRSEQLVCHLILVVIKVGRHAVATKHKAEPSTKVLAIVVSGDSRNEVGLERADYIDASSSLFELLPMHVLMVNLPRYWERVAEDQRLGLLELSVGLPFAPCHTPLQ